MRFRWLFLDFSHWGWNVLNFLKIWGWAVLNLFLISAKFEAHCSYKIVLIKKNACKFFTLKYGCKIIACFRIFDYWSCFISLISHLSVQFNQSLCRLFESRKGLTPQLLLIFHTPFLFPRLLKRDHCVIFRGWLMFFVLQKIEDNHV